MKSTVCGIVQETCVALWEVLLPEYVKVPSTKEEWLGISQQFEALWNFPNCIGAVNPSLSLFECMDPIIGVIDGKHVITQAPSNGGSYYYYQN